MRYGTTMAEITAKKGERAERQVGQLLAWDTRAECESLALTLAGNGSGGARSGGPPTLSSVRSTPSKLFSPHPDKANPARPKTIYCNQQLDIRLCASVVPKPTSAPNPQSSAIR